MVAVVVIVVMTVVVMVAVVMAIVVMATVVLFQGHHEKALSVLPQLKEDGTLPPQVRSAKSQATPSPLSSSLSPPSSPLPSILSPPLHLLPSLLSCRLTSTSSATHWWQLASWTRCSPF